MASDDFDYMSDDILLQCEKQDVRPGLIYNRTQKRSHEILKKKLKTDEENKKLFPNKSVLEIERRDEGLKEVIPESNKGFALLQKMGYKPGSAIGKSGSGILEPVAIAVKVNRHGLGREAALKEVEEQKIAIRERLLKKTRNETDFESYRSHMTKKLEERQTRSDLRKSQIICEQLDRAKDINTAAEPWFWTIEAQQATESQQNNDSESDTDHETDEENADEKCAKIDKEEEIEFEVTEKLEILTLYLRRTYCYCIWCGTQFDDEKDMQDSCPGTSRSDH